MSNENNSTIASILAAGAPAMPDASSAPSAPTQVEQQPANPPVSQPNMNLEPNNTPQFTDKNRNTNPQNNPVQSLIDHVSSNQTQEPNAQQPQPAQPQQPPQNPAQPAEPGAVATQIVQQFMRNENINFNMMEGIDVEAMTTRLTEGGDPSAMFEVIDQAANNSAQQAVSTFLRMLPQFTDQIVARAVEQAREVSQVDNTWGEFVKVHPGFAAKETLVRPALESMLKVPGAQRADAFAAAAQLYAGALGVPVNGPHGSNNPSSNQSSTIDVINWLDINN